MILCCSNVSPSQKAGYCPFIHSRISTVAQLVCSWLNCCAVWSCHPWNWLRLKCPLAPSISAPFELRINSIGAPWRNFGGSALKKPFEERGNFPNERDLSELFSAHLAKSRTLK